ncbi:MAG: hypothetical protein M1167_01365 [Chloroflexi bacterium]|nr:hypothetical protein [Chloroflexota bacterium]
MQPKQQKAWKSWSKAFASALVFLVALVAYVSTRDYIIQMIGIYFTGVFEGASSMILVFLFAVKYGDALTEVYFGLRELGHRRLLLEEQEQTQEDKKSDNQH